MLKTLAGRPLVKAGGRGCPISGGRRHVDDARVVMRERKPVREGGFRFAQA